MIFHVFGFDFILGSIEVFLHEGRTAHPHLYHFFLFILFEIREVLFEGFFVEFGVVIFHRNARMVNKQVWPFEFVAEKFEIFDELQADSFVHCGEGCVQFEGEGGQVYGHVCCWIVVATRYFVTIWHLYI